MSRANNQYSSDLTAAQEDPYQPQTPGPRGRGRARGKEPLARTRSLGPTKDVDGQHDITENTINTFFNGLKRENAVLVSLDHVSYWSGGVGR
jgi:hypothetical protein